jgi:hypothetical protein
MTGDGEREVCNHKKQADKGAACDGSVRGTSKTGVVNIICIWFAARALAMADFGISGYYHDARLYQSRNPIRRKKQLSSNLKFTVNEHKIAIIYPLLLFPSYYNVKSELRFESKVLQYLVYLFSTCPNKAPWGNLCALLWSPI